MIQSVRISAVGAGQALLAFGFYSSHDAVVKFLGASYAAPQVLFFAVLMSFPLVTVMLMNDRTEGNLRPRRVGWMVLRTACTTITGLCAFYAFSRLPLTQAYAIFFATPLAITIMAIPILGETVRLRRWIAILVGLVGVYIVLRPGQAPLSLGHLAAIVATVAGAMASVIVRKVGREERTAVLMLYSMVANFVVTGLLLPFVYVPVPIAHLGGFALMAVLGSVGTLLIIAAYRNAEAAIVAPMQYSQVIWAVGYGWFFFGERLDWHTALGMAVIIASGIYIVLRESRARVSATRPAQNAPGPAAMTASPGSTER